MSKIEEPARLLDAASETTDPVRAVLRSGQRGLPGPADLARLAARLPLGPLPPPSGSPPAAPPPAAPPMTPLRLIAGGAAPSALPGAIVGALLALGVVGGVWWHDAKAPPEGAAPAHVTEAKSAAAVEGPAIAPLPADRDPAPAPSATPSSRSTSPTIRSALPVEASAEVVPNDAPSPDALPLGPGSSPAAATETETEVHLLQRAQSALGASSSAALALTDEHARRFPGGALAQEREFIAVSALLALGRAPEARSRAARLLERFPASAYRGRLESLGLGN